MQKIAFPFQSIRQSITYRENSSLPFPLQMYCRTKYSFDYCSQRFITDKFNKSRKIEKCPTHTEFSSPISFEESEIEMNFYSVNLSLLKNA